MLKDMKKTLSFIICIMMVFSAFAVSASSITINETQISSEVADGIVTVTVPYTVPAEGFANGSQVSLLAYLSETGSAIDSAVALDQITYDGSSSTISFKANKADVAKKTIYIKMGGTKLAASNVAQYRLPVTEFVVEFYNSTDASATLIGSPVDVVKGTALTAAQIPAAPTVEGKKFKYWTKDSVTEFDLTTSNWDEIADEDGVIKLYAYMTDFYEATISFATTETTVKTVGGKIPAGTEIPVATTTEEGKVFAGWSLTEGGEVISNADLLAKDFGSETDSANAVTLYPIFKDKATYTLGDVTGEGDIDVLDALEIVKYDAGLVTLDETALLAADVTGEGDVDVLDALEIVKYDAGIIEKFPAEK